MGRSPKQHRLAISKPPSEKPHGCGSCSDRACTWRCGITECPRTTPGTISYGKCHKSLHFPLWPPIKFHYYQRHDAYLSEVLAAIGGRRTLVEADGFRPASDERFLKHPDEMADRFARYPGAVARSAEMGRRLAFDLGLVGVAPRLPDFPMPGHFQDEMDYLRHLTWEGARDVYPGSVDGIDPAARRRLDHELDIIESLGFAGYFLVVKDLVDFARDQGIYCQIRGSGADSAVCRCIGLTRVDPIRLHLPFERFLSEERGKPPDIDIDFEADRREEVIQYCYRRYGRERGSDGCQCHHISGAVGSTRCGKNLWVHTGTGGWVVQVCRHT